MWQPTQMPKNDSRNEKKINSATIALTNKAIPIILSGSNSEVMANPMRAAKRLGA